jgi:hypothetical protein
VIFKNWKWQYPRVHPEDSTTVKDLWEECLKSGNPFTLECRMRFTILILF